MAGDNENNTLHNNAIGWGLILAVMGAILWLFWFYYDAEIRSIIRWVRYIEMQFISLFVSSDFNVVFNGRAVNFERGVYDTPRFSPEDLTFQHLSYFTALAMQPLKYPIILILTGMAAWAYYKGPKTYYRKKLTIDTLIERQMYNFPTITPFVKFNPSTVPPRPPGSPVPAELPAFAEALGPEEWLAYNGVQVPDGNVDKESAARHFKKQLRGLWKGPAKLKNYEQILLAAFCLKAARKREQGDEMMGRVAKCWSHDKGLELSKDPKLLKDARAVFKNKDLCGGTLKICNQHAFTTTALLGALDHARAEGGVLAPAQFVWLRGHDRTLWYPLNNLGRQSFHMESIGAMSHYKSERRTRRPIPVPKVEDAVKTITDYMKSAVARPIPQLDYTNSQKRGVKKAV